MDYKALLFSAEGRINRAKFWGGSLLVAVIVLVVAGIAALIISAVGDSAIATIIGIIAAIVYLGAIWPAVCLGIKRFHDRNKSGWWVLIQFVPIIGAFWYLIEAGFLKGTDGPNQFGPDPLQVG